MASCFELVMTQAGGLVALFVCLLVLPPWRLRTLLLPVVGWSVVVFLGFALAPSNELSDALHELFRVIDKVAGTVGVIGFVIAVRHTGKRFWES